MLICHHASTKSKIKELNKIKLKKKKKFNLPPVRPQLDVGIRSARKDQSAPGAKTKDRGKQARCMVGAIAYHQPQRPSFNLALAG